MKGPLRFVLVVMAALLVVAALAWPGLAPRFKLKAFREGRRPPRIADFADPQLGPLLLQDAAVIDRLTAQLGALQGPDDLLRHRAGWALVYLGLARQHRPVNDARVVLGALAAEARPPQALRSLAGDARGTFELGWIDAMQANQLLSQSPPEGEQQLEALVYAVCAHEGVGDVTKTLEQWTESHSGQARESLRAALQARREIREVQGEKAPVLLGFDQHIPASFQPEYSRTAFDFLRGSGCVPSPGRETVDARILPFHCEAGPAPLSFMTEKGLQVRAGSESHEGVGLAFRIKAAYFALPPFNWAENEQLLQDLRTAKPTPEQVQRVNQWLGDGALLPWRWGIPARAFQEEDI